jgi:hypothetical protein
MSPKYKAISWPVNSAYQCLSCLKGSLTCRKLLRHGADGFTSHPKEVVLRIFLAVKHPLLSAGLEPANLGSIIKHFNQYTTDNDGTIVKENMFPMQRQCLENYWFCVLKSGVWHVKVCLLEQNYPSQNQKTYVPGFSPKYFTIWGRNMVTKHATGEQITGNWGGFLEKIC